MADWYRDHNASPECYPDAEYLEWAQDNGLYVDATGNVDYGPPDRCLSCGAEVDHYLGCPDDPDPDYAAEAELRKDGLS